MDVGDGQISVFNGTDCPASIWGISPFYLSPDTCSNITRATLFGPAAWDSFHVSSPASCFGNSTTTPATLNIFSDFNCTSLIASYESSSSGQNGSCVNAPQEFMGVAFVCGSASSTGGPEGTSSTQTGSSTTGTAATSTASTAATTSANGTSNAVAWSRFARGMPFSLMAFIAFVEMLVW